MKTSHIFRALGLLAAGALSQTASLSAAPAEKPTTRVEVNFFEPQRFTDVGDRYNDTERNREYILGELRKYLQERAQSYVPEGQTLAVTITDVDLAGEFEPWRGASATDVRIVKEIYPPRMKLSFRLTNANGDVLKQGERELTNLNFLMTAPPTFMNDPYRHDKALIDNWLRSEFRSESKS